MSKTQEPKILDLLSLESDLNSDIQALNAKYAKKKHEMRQQADHELTNLRKKMEMGDKIIKEEVERLSTEEISAMKKDEKGKTQPADEKKLTKAKQLIEEVYQSLMA